MVRRRYVLLLRECESAIYRISGAGLYREVGENVRKVDVDVRSH